MMIFMDQTSSAKLAPLTKSRTDSRKKKNKQRICPGSVEAFEAKFLFLPLLFFKQHKELYGASFETFKFAFETKLSN